MNMKLETSNKINMQKNSQNVSFKGVGETASATLHFLNAYPAIGAVCIDAGSMGIPRTCVDSFRGVDAAKETAFREFGSTTNFCLMGIWGTLAAALMGLSFNKKFKGAQVHKTFADSKTIDVMANLYNNGAIENKTKNIENFTQNFCNSIETLHSTEWKGLSDSAKKEISEILKSSISNSNFDKKADKIAKQKIISLITADTGANQVARLKINDKSVNLSLSNLVDHFVSLGRNFTSVADGKVSEDFVKSLKSNKMAASLAGLTVPLIIALSTQPLNRYLTKLRTGKEGFVGVQGEQADTSGNFGLQKIVACAALSAASLATIGKNPITKLQFSGLIPNISQFKLIYGLTIGSRILSARDKNELRETCIKDSLGFANWLILGGFVSKLVARALDKNIMNYDKSTLKEGAGKLARGWHWLTNATIRGTEEILIKDMKDNGLNVLKDDGTPKSFKELMKELPKTMTATRRKISTANKAQLAGYLYSMVALGIGIPVLNIIMTNHFTKKKQMVADSDNTTKSKPTISLNQYFMDPEMIQKLKKVNS